MVSVIKVLRIRDVMSIQLYTSYLYHSPPRLREYQRSRKQKEKGKKKKEDPEDVKDKTTAAVMSAGCCGYLHETGPPRVHYGQTEEGLIRFHSDKQSMVLGGKSYSSEAQSLLSYPFSSK